MKNRTIKIIILVVFIFATMYQIVPIGDYCSGLAQGLAMLLFIGLFLISFFIFLSFDLYYYIKNKKKFDFIPLVLLALFVSMVYVFEKSEDKKIWTSVVCEGQVKGRDELNNSHIRLYANNTFSLTNVFTDWRCTFQGNYKINKGMLVLDRKDIAKLTDSIFTNTYKIDLTDSLFIPANNHFLSIKIQNCKVTLK